MADCMLNPIRRLHEAPCKCLVGSSGGEGSGGKADALVGCVEDGVKALEEGVAVDEVKTLAGVRSEVADDEVDARCNTTNVSVECPGEDLSVGGELEGGTTGDEEQALEGAELGGGDREEAGSSVCGGTGRRLVFGEGVGGNEDEGCAY